MRELTELLRTIRVVDLVDLALVAALLWAGIVWLRTARARLALLGLVALAGVYLLAAQTGLILTARLLQAFVAAFALIVVVVFQEDIRRGFEQLALLGLRRGSRAPAEDSVDSLVRALARLVGDHRGALVVLPGRQPLERHLDGGVELEGRLSEPLLLSLFDPHSPGHDGAVVVDGSRVRSFAVHLPLSTDHAQLGQLGTRHAAGLGLSERCDALCLIVSEERGTLSVARDGVLERLARPELASDAIHEFLEERRREPVTESRGRFGVVLARWREGAVALALAAGFWVLAGPGSGTTEATRQVPVRVLDLPPGYALESVDPPEVTVTLLGPRRDLLLLEPGAVEVRVNAALAELGRRTFTVDTELVATPPRVEALDVVPDSVKISLRRVDSG